MVSPWKSKGATRPSTRRFPHVRALARQVLLECGRGGGRAPLQLLRDLWASDACEASGGLWAARGERHERLEKQPGGFPRNTWDLLECLFIGLFMLVYWFIVVNYDTSQGKYEGALSPERPEMRFKGARRAIV